LVGTKERERRNSDKEQESRREDDKEEAEGNTEGLIGGWKRFRAGETFEWRG
jgi:hypothetical protein